MVSIMAQCHICLHDAMGHREDTVSAVRIHGFFPSMKQAQEQVHRLAAEQLDVHSYIIEECMHWFPVQDPVKGSALEEEEIQAPENEDRESGRMGSVCELKKHERRNPKLTEDERVTIFDERPANKAATSKQVKTQQKQLEELLGGSVDPITSLTEYAAARDRLALLRAFQRKLNVLHLEGVQKMKDAADLIHELDERHPEYQEAYTSNYERALKQSGISRDKVPFMKYMTTSKPTV
jgi:hypothetical protein